MAPACGDPPQDGLWPRPSGAVSVVCLIDGIGPGAGVGEAGVGAAGVGEAGVGATGVGAAGVGGGGAGVGAGAGQPFTLLGSQPLVVRGFLLGAHAPSMALKQCFDLTFHVHMTHFAFAWQAHSHAL